MYLSRLLLNPRSREARRDLASPYELHRTLARVFPGDRADADGPNAERQPGHGLLFRAEPEAPGGPQVLVQSLIEPDWRRLPDGYARVEGPKVFEPVFSEGQRLRFRLVANPTVRKKTGETRSDGKPRVTRVPLVHDRAPEGHPDVTMGYLDWLDRKAEVNGFAVENVIDAPFQVTGGRSKQGLTLFGVQFDGVLSVLNHRSVVSAVHSGVGPAKGFGFGLLSLMRS